MTCEILCKNILSSVSNTGITIRSLQLRYPLQIHAELMTHRVFSRNARSSRAVPTARMIEEVRDAPFVPKYWGANQKGMQSGAEHSALVEILEINGDILSEVSPTEAWLSARDAAVRHAAAFAKAGYHKQICNRLLAPFLHIDTLVTSTNFSNWDYLRDSKHAEPHIRDLAQVMKEEIARSPEPQLLLPGEWHVPFITAEDWAAAGERVDQRAGLRGDLTIGEWRDRTRPLRAAARDEVIKLSVPRCAAISYKPFEGTTRSFEEELAKHDELAGNGHWSPFEHQATPDYRAGNGNWASPSKHGNLEGWVQYRKTFPGEYR